MFWDDALPTSMEALLADIGEAGARMAEIGATEGAAGNISVYFREPLDIGDHFPIEETIQLPCPAPDLAGQFVVVTGSGRRLRDLESNPHANLGLVRVNEGGQSGSLFTSPKRNFVRLTSEFNSHLAVHQDYVSRKKPALHSIVHAQPHHLTFLSHIKQYQDETTLTRALMRWQPETLLTFPEGFGCLPYLLPGSVEMMNANVEKLRVYRLVVWSKHGVMARWHGSVRTCADWIEYAEASARYEYMNMLSGNRATGITPTELRGLATGFGIEQKLYQ